MKTNYPALYTLIVVFFFWGFIASGNNVLIPFCKEYFHLDQFQSQLIDFAFYTAYFIGSLGLFAASTFSQKDFVMKWGYKKSIIRGLLVSVVGALLILLGINSDSYFGMLTGLFVVGLGFSLQQTAANPFAISLGDEKTGASRVNLGGGVNSLGTTLGPLIVAYFLFGSPKSISAEQIQSLSLQTITVLYAIVALLFAVAAAIFYFSKKLPNIQKDEPIERSNKALGLLFTMTVLLVLAMVSVFLTYKKELPSFLQNMSLESIEMFRMYALIAALVVVVVSILYAAVQSKKSPKGWGAMQYPQLSLGMLAIFMYVGVEVAVGSNLGELLQTEAFGNIPQTEIAMIISMYWGSMMVGRWAGAVYAFSLERQKELIALVTLPLLAFGVLLFANHQAGYEVESMFPYVVCVLLQIALIIFTKNQATKTLIGSGVFGALALFVGLNTTGTTAIYAFLSAGLACSVIWSAIFNLALMGIGKYTTQGSTFLILMILGGGIIPPLQGKLADIIGIHNSYIVSLLCFVYLIVYGLIVKPKKVLVEK